MSKWITKKKVRERSGWSNRTIERKCAKGELVFEIIGGRKYYDPNCHERLRDRGGMVKLKKSAELADVPASKRDEALDRLGHIRQFENFAAKFVGSGTGTYSEALNDFVSVRGIKNRTFWRWLKRFHEEGLLGLVDMRGGGKFMHQIISAEAFEVFKSLYLTEQQLTVKTCWRNICYLNKSEDKDWKIPGLRWMYEYIAAAIPLGVQVLHREGLAAYEAKCAPYIESDPDGVTPGQVWVGDHSQFNCWIRHRNRWVRPWITAWEDMRSRQIVGWWVSASPNQTTILLAFKRAVEIYGPPDSGKIDNGRDYDSELWTGTTKDRRKALRAGYIDEKMVAGIYAMMDIGVSFAIPYHPQSKPIERFFDTMDCQFTKTIPTYCGKDTERRPEDLFEILKSQKALREAYDLSGFCELVGKYVEIYNNSAHTGKGMDGRSPAEVMATRRSRRVLAEGVAELLLRVWSGELTVGKNGVRFKGIWYGQFSPELLAFQGKKVRVAYDPDDLRSVYVYDAATLKLLTIADQGRLISYGSAVSEEDLRWAMRQKARAVRIARDYRDSRLTANMDLTDLTLKAMEDAKKPAPEPSLPETLRPVRTPMNGQVAEHKRRETVRAVKKAVGAEGIEEVLDIDFSLLKQKDKYAGVKLFDD